MDTSASRPPLGPLVGGALYELSPYLASHASIHLNLHNAWAPPLFLILLEVSTSALQQNLPNLMSPHRSFPTEPVPLVTPVRGVPAHSAHAPFSSQRSGATASAPTM